MKKRLLKNDRNLAYLVSLRRTSSRSFYSSKKCTWLQYKEPQIRAPGTTFSIFSGEVRLEGHGSCCRFATLTGVLQGAHICLAKQWVNGKLMSYLVEQNYGISSRKKKRSEVEVLPVVYLIADSARKHVFFWWAMQHRCGGGREGGRIPGLLPIAVHLTFLEKVHSSRIY